MALWGRAHPEQNVIAHEDIGAVEAGNRQQANRGKQAAVMGEDVFEDLPGGWQFLGHETATIKRRGNVWMRCKAQNPIIGIKRGMLTF